MKARNRFVELTLAAGFVLGVVTNMVAKPTVTESRDPGGQQATGGPEQDPNLPNLGHDVPEAPITWKGDGVHTPLQVSFKNHPAYSDEFYYGFNEKGSWIYNVWDKKFYIWNLQNRTFIVGAEDITKLTVDELFSLRNSVGARRILQSWQNKIGADPNFPYLQEPLPGAPVFWFVGGNGIEVVFNSPRCSGNYIGYNDRGSWIRNDLDQKVYVWNLQSRTLTVGADNWASIPTDVLLSLRNSPIAERALAAKGIKPVSAAAKNNNKTANAAGRSKPGARAKTMQSANRGPEPDPNLPPPGNSFTASPINWSAYGTATTL